eukprot:Pgem_evm1s930
MLGFGSLESVCHLHHFRCHNLIFRGNNNVVNDKKEECKKTDVAGERKGQGNAESNPLPSTQITKTNELGEHEGKSNEPFKDAKHFFEKPSPKD